MFKGSLPFNKVDEEVSPGSLKIDDVTSGTREVDQHGRFRGELVKLAKLNLGACSISSRNTLGNIHTLHLNRIRYITGDINELPLPAPSSEESSLSESERKLSDSYSTSEL